MIGTVPDIHYPVGSGYFGGEHYDIRCSYYTNFMTVCGIFHTNDDECARLNMDHPSKGKVILYAMFAAVY
jgi:hypothetical protein